VPHRRAGLGLISAVTNKGELRWMVLDGAVNCQRRREFGAPWRSDIGARCRLSAAQREGGYGAVGGRGSAGELAARRRLLLCARR
jgi:hypothetical protein